MNEDKMNEDKMNEDKMNEDKMNEDKMRIKLTLEEMLVFLPNSRLVN